MSLCTRLIGGIFDGLNTITSFWQTPREVEWAKAAKLAGKRADLLANHGAIFADGLAEREAEEEVAEPHTPQYVGYVDSDGVTRVERAGVRHDDAMERHYRTVRGLHEAITALVPETSATTPGAVDGPAVGSPDKPTAVVGPNSPKWLRDLIEATEDYVGAPRGSLSSPLESADLAEPVADSVVANERDWFGTVLAAYARGEYPPIADVPGLRWRDCAHSAEVEPPASAPSAESPAPEFDWVTTAIPVIAGVLAEHKFLPIMGRCECPSLPRVADWQRWSEHVSPIIAIAVQSDLLSTIYEDTTFAINAFSGDCPRPLADFPKHQNPRM